MAGLWYNLFGEILKKMFADINLDLFAYKKETKLYNHVSLDLPSLWWLGHYYSL